MSAQKFQRRSALDEPTNTGPALASDITLADAGTSEQLISLQPGEIHIDAGLQTRDKISQETISEYAQAMADGAQFPPILVYRNGDTYALIKGFHRIKAHTVAFAGEPIRCKVFVGSRRDALREALGDNADHGLQLSSDDKRKKVKIALADEEWGAWSDREIARLCKVGHPLVARVRKEVTGTDSSDQPPANRTYTNRHGGQSTMRTGGISQANAARKAPSTLTQAPTSPAPAPTPPSPAGAAAVPLSPPVTPTIPADLEGAGWAIRRVGGEGNYYCLNRTASKATATHEEPGGAIAEAYVMQGTPWRDLLTPVAVQPTSGKFDKERAIALAALYRRVIESLPEFRRMVRASGKVDSVEQFLGDMIRELRQKFQAL